MGEMLNLAWKVTLLHAISEMDLLHISDFILKLYVFMAISYELYPLKQVKLYTV